MRIEMNAVEGRYVRYFSSIKEARAMAFRLSLQGARKMMGFLSAAGEHAGQPARLEDWRGRNDKDFGGPAGKVGGCLDDRD